MRLLFNRLVQVVDELHRDAVSPPQRAVLEYILRNGPATVPMIARARNVTRQHIQGIANELFKQQLLLPVPNPAHRRSPTLTLTEAGHSRILEIMAREVEHVAARLGDLDPEELRSAARTLAAVRERL